MSCDVCWLHFSISCKCKLKWYPRSKYQYLTVIPASCSPKLCLFIFHTLLYLFFRLTFYTLCILLHMLAAARIPPLCDQLSNIKFSTKTPHKSMPWRVPKNLLKRPVVGFASVVTVCHDRLRPYFWDWFTNSHQFNPCWVQNHKVNLLKMLPLYHVPEDQCVLVCGVRVSIDVCS